MDTIRVFIGTEPNQWLPKEVLRWSIKRRTAAQVEFHELKYIPLNLKIKKYGGFAFYRFSIPEMCQYEGRAIYLDADTMLLADIQELYQLEMGEHGALACRRSAENEGGRYTGVMLLNAAKLKHWKLSDWVEAVNKNPALYNETLWATPEGLNGRDFGDLPDTWNQLDRCDETTKIMHYTDIPRKPWKNPEHPFGSLFLKELKSAVENEEIPLDAIEHEIRYGHIYPNILNDMNQISS